MLYHLSIGLKSQASCNPLGGRRFGTTGVRWKKQLIITGSGFDVARARRLHADFPTLERALDAWTYPVAFRCQPDRDAAMENAFGTNHLRYDSATMRLLGADAAIWTQLRPHDAIRPAVVQSASAAAQTRTRSAIRQPLCFGTIPARVHDCPSKRRLTLSLPSKCTTISMR